MVIFTFEAKGYRDVSGRYAKRSDTIRRRMRAQFRTLARGMVGSLRHYAPEDTGVFKAGIGFRTTWVGDVLRTTFFVGGKHAYLLPYLTGGTPPHPIPRGGSAEQIAKGYPLSWIDRLTGERRFAWSVMHPGTFPDPFVERAVDSMSPQMAMALSNVARSIAWVS